MFFWTNQFSLAKIFFQSDIGEWVLGWELGYLGSSPSPQDLLPEWPIVSHFASLSQFHKRRLDYDA